MPPPSSPVPRLSSVPSAASTVHTIASRSPLRPLVSALRERTGGQLVQFWAMLSPHLATTSPAINQPGQRGQGGGLSVILPPLACVLLPAASFRLLRSPLFALISSARSCLTFCPPSCPPLLLYQVVRACAGHQPGQAIPSRSSCRPSPPCRGAVRTFRTDPGRGAGGVQP